MWVKQLGHLYALVVLAENPEMKQACCHYAVFLSGVHL